MRRRALLNEERRSKDFSKVGNGAPKTFPKWGTALPRLLQSGERRFQDYKFDISFFGVLERYGILICEALLKFHFSTKLLLSPLWRSLGSAVPHFGEVFGAPFPTLERASPHRGAPRSKVGKSLKTGERRLPEGADWGAPLLISSPRSKVGRALSPVGERGRIFG